MPNISQWRLDTLEEHETNYYKLLKEKQDLIDALTPLIIEIMEQNGFLTPTIEAVEDLED